MTNKLPLDVRLIKLREEFREEFLPSPNPIELADHMIIGLVQEYNLSYNTAKMMFFDEQPKDYEIVKYIKGSLD